MINSYNVTQLRNAGKIINLPFCLSLDGSDNTLNCEKLLRIIPGKRVVLLGTWGNHKIVAKLFFKPLQINNHVRREASGIKALLKAGISTPDLLFSGKTKDKGVGVLLFKYIFPSTELGKFWGAVKSVEEKRNLVYKLMVILSKMHKVGIKQLDLHLNNFLVNNNTIYIIDGATIKWDKRGRPLKLHDRINNLALLFAQFTLPDYSLVCDLYTEYIKTSGLKNKKNTFKKLQCQIERWRRWRVRNHIKANFYKYSKLVRRKSFTRFMLCKRPYYTRAMASFLDNPDKIINNPKSLFLKKGNSATVIRINIDNHDLVVKRYNIKNFRHRLRRFLRPSRATHSWRSAHLLLMLGIATPMPVAILERRFGYFRGRAYFAYEYIDGLNAIDYFKSGDLDKELDVAKRIADIFQNLAIAKISHHDMKGTNIIINQRYPVLVDLDAMCMHISDRRFEHAHKRDKKIFLNNWPDTSDVSKLFKDLLYRNKVDFLK